MKRVLSVLLVAAPIVLLFRDATLKEAGLFFLAAGLHEAGHLIALRRCGARAGGLRLGPGGAVIGARFGLLPYRREAAVYLAGPAASLAGAAVTLFLLRARFTFPLLYFFFCNALFGVLNLIPARGLDGYQALFSLLCISREEEAARRALAPLSIASVVLLTGAGLAVMLAEQNASLLILSLALIAEGKTKKLRFGGTK